MGHMTKPFQSVLCDFTMFNAIEFARVYLLWVTLYSPNGIPVAFAIPLISPLYGSGRVSASGALKKERERQKTTPLNCKFYMLFDFENTLIQERFSDLHSRACTVNFWKQVCTTTIKLQSKNYFVFMQIFRTIQQAYMKTPAQQALAKFQRKIKRLVGRPKPTWVALIQKEIELTHKHFTQTTYRKAQRAVVESAMATQSKMLTTTIWKQ